VRNLPTWATKDQLESVFSEIGPLRRCILITNKGEKDCKGYGFVHYSFEEDAKKAIQKLQAKSFMTSTNLMLLDWANRRTKDKISDSNTEDNSTKENKVKEKTKKPKLAKKNV